MSIVVVRQMKARSCKDICDEGDPILTARINYLNAAIGDLPDSCPRSRAIIFIKKRTLAFKNIFKGIDL